MAPSKKLTWAAGQRGRSISEAFCKFNIHSVRIRACVLVLTLLFFHPVWVKGSLYVDESIREWKNRNWIYEESSWIKNQHICMYIIIYCLYTIHTCVHIYIYVPMHIHKCVCVYMRERNRSSQIGQDMQQVDHKARSKVQIFELHVR